MTEKKIDSNMKGALWNKVSEKGLKYLNGSIEINGKKYWISVFKNTKKMYDNSPSFNIVINDPDQNKKTESVVKDDDIDDIF